MGTSIVITSGKGGTGKSSITAGIACALANRGRRVLCIDCDIGLRNLDLLLGMTDIAAADFTDVIDGRFTLEEAAAVHPTLPGLYLILAPMQLADSTIPLEGMKKLIDEAKQAYDYVLLDSPAGLGAGLQLACCSTDRAIVCATCDATSLRDAERASRLIEEQVPKQHLVVNRVRPRLLKKLDETIDDAMDAVGLPLLGMIPEDETVTLNGFLGKPILQAGSARRKNAANAFNHIAQRIEGENIPLMRMR